MEPILKKEIDSKLEDGIEVIIRGETFDKPIYPTGELVYSSVKMINKLNGAILGTFCYREPLDDDEMIEKMGEVIAHPEAILYPAYRSKK